MQVELLSEFSDTVFGYAKFIVYLLGLFVGGRMEKELAFSFANT